MRWHNLTCLFARNMMDRVAIVNNCWTPSYSTLQQLEKGSLSNVPKGVMLKISPIENLYYNFPSPSTNKISQIFDYNGPTNFLSLKENNVDIRVTQSGDLFDTKAQKTPDLSLLAQNPNN